MTKPEGSPSFEELAAQERAAWGRLAADYPGISKAKQAAATGIASIAGGEQTVTFDEHSDSAERDNGEQRG